MTIRYMGLGFYRAEKIITLPRSRDGERGPYYTPWMGNMRIVRAWGRSEDSAFLRCQRSAEKIAQAHEEWRKRRNARVTIR